MYSFLSFFFLHVYHRYRQQQSKVEANLEGSKQCTKYTTSVCIFCVCVSEVSSICTFTIRNEVENSLHPYKILSENSMAIQRRYVRGKVSKLFDPRFICFSYLSCKMRQRRLQCSLFKNLTRFYFYSILDSFLRSISFFFFILSALS